MKNKKGPAKALTNRPRGAIAVASTNEVDPGLAALFKRTGKLLERRRRAKNTSPQRMLARGLGVMMLPLETWGVKKREARKAVLSWIAAKSEFTKRQWTWRDTPNQLQPKDLLSAIMQNRDTQVDDDLLEEAVFSVFREDIPGLAHAVWEYKRLKKRFQTDPDGFWSRLAKYSAQKNAGHHWIERQPAWVLCAIECWIGMPHYPEFAGTPPFCLWSDGAIQYFFEKAPSTTDSIRQRLTRDCRLIRPEGFSFGIVNGKWKKMGRAHTKR